jgi:SAM-dependent methyltransferase
VTQQAWQDRYSQPGRVWSGKVNPWLQEVVAPMPTGKALDLACGEGGDAVWLASQGWQVTAVDFAPAALARGAAAADELGVSDHITWVAADLAQWRPVERFDLVAMHFLHTPDLSLRDAAIRTAWAATGGVLLIVSHDPENAVRGTAGGPPDPAVIYGPAQVLATIGDASAEVVVAETRDRTSSAGIWVDSVVVLRRR